MVATYNFGSVYIIIGPRREKTCLRWLTNNTGADQPARPRSLISTFVIRFLESIIYELATGKISSFLACLCSLEDWFESLFVGHPEDRFSHDEAHIMLLTGLYSTVLHISHVCM